MFFSSVKIMSGDNYWSRSRREATIYYITHNRHSQLKTDYYLNNKTKVYSSTFKFTFDEFWYSLGTSIFGNSSSVSILYPDYLPHYLSLSYGYDFTNKTSPFVEERFYWRHWGSTFHRLNWCWNKTRYEVI